MSEHLFGADNVAWEQKHGCRNCQLPGKAPSRSPTTQALSMERPDYTYAEGHADAVGSFPLSSWGPFHCWTAGVFRDPKRDP